MCKPYFGLDANFATYYIGRNKVTHKGTKLMRTPLPFWETEYKADRRKHCHRCRCCKRIIKPGERVVMARVSSKATYAMHAECAPEGSQPRSNMKEWAFGHMLRILGVTPTDPKNYAQVRKLRAEHLLTQ